MYRHALLVFSLCFAAPFLANAQEPILEYDRDPDAVVIEVIFWGDMSAGDHTDTTPDLRIYGDGRVIVHSKVKPKGQRDYETWLTDAEMAELIRFMYDHGGMEYEYGMVNEKAKEVARQSRTRRGVSDAGHMSIRVSLKKFRPAESDEPAQSDFTHLTGGHAIKFIADWYPQLEEAQNLAAIQARLIELMRSPDLELVLGPPNPLAGEWLFQNVERYAAIPIHRTATPGDRLTSRWLALELREAGYDTREVQWPLRQYRPIDYSFRVGDKSMTVFPVWMPPDGHTGANAPLVNGSGGIDETADGKIVVMDSSVITRERWSTGINDYIDEAARHGARAIVFVLNTPSGEIAAINAREPYHQKPLPIPAALVQLRHEKELLDAASRNEKARLQMNGVIESTAAVNVVASIDRGKPWFVVTTPSSGWFNCAGERGAGVALFLGLAQWMAREDLPFSLRFIANSGHELDNMGAHFSLDDYGPPPEDVACWLHLGASIATRSWQIGTNRPLSEYNFLVNVVSTPELLPLVSEAFEGVPDYHPRATGPVLGELRHFMDAGYQTWGIFGGHHYFHTPLDTAECTSPELLEPVGDALRKFVNSMRENAAVQ